MNSQDSETGSSLPDQQAGAGNRVEAPRESDDRGNGAPGTAGLLPHRASAGENSSALPSLSDEDRRGLLAVARMALERAAAGAAPPRVCAASERLLEHRACFVTLTHAGTLRGCIGHVRPRAPLYLAVAENTRWAALHDPRFEQVQPREVPAVRIEISVLSDLKAVEVGSPEELIDLLRPHEHGVVLEVAGRSATFLPQVWAQLPEKVEFMEHLCQKCGCEPSDWRRPDAVISVFVADSFEEPER